MRHFMQLILGHALLLPSMAQAQSVTFHADVAPIIYTHCTECHRVGEIGPMPLTNFSEVYAYGEFIEYVTASKLHAPLDS